MIQRILAVDDEPAMLLLLERIVREKTAYSIVTTNNPLEIPSMLEREGFDVIITDLRMAGLGGLDILRYVRDHDRPELVIVVTAFGATESILEAVSLGVFGYLTKPFKKEQLLGTIERAMRCRLARLEEERVAAMLGLEPYESAERALRLEYLRRLAARCAGDASEVAARAGRSLDEVRAALGLRSVT